MDGFFRIIDSPGHSCLRVDLLLTRQASNENGDDGLVVRSGESNQINTIWLDESEVKGRISRFLFPVNHSQVVRPPFAITQN